ncbi:MAG: outer membrane lipoprotein-sorting protein [Gammaproteobacteria bacterium]|nr:outer membrane lipoprotein-sorting protein [Gammaproteobacteria bacterium]
MSNGVMGGVRAVASVVGVLASMTLAAEELTGADLVQRCDLDTFAGHDNRSVLTVLLRDASGNEKKNVYKRYWKDLDGKGGIDDKMILFTEFPPDASGTGFMRWGYVAGADNNAEQWLYLPSLKSIRRVSVRDPGDSFLGSELTYQDISPRLLTQDTHTLLRTEQRNGAEYYVVESLPKETRPLYGKVVAWYAKVSQWADCRKARVEFYEPNGSLLKTQVLKWQQVGKAWLWDEVVVNNAKTGHSSVFRVTSPEIDVGLSDALFSERTLQRGIR